MLQTCAANLGATHASASLKSPSLSSHGYQPVAFGVKTTRKLDRRVMEMRLKLVSAWILGNFDDYSEVGIHPHAQLIK
jgi:hypothetical protein